MIKCRKCKTALRKTAVSWTVVFHGNLLRKENNWEIEPLGEGDYVDSLILECECGYEVKVEIKSEDISNEHIEKVVKKFRGIKE